MDLHTNVMDHFSRLYQHRKKRNWVAMRDTRSQDAQFVLVDARARTGEMTKSDRYSF